MLIRFAWWLPCVLLTGCAGSQEQALNRLDEVAGRVLAQPCEQPEYHYRQIKNLHVPGLVDEIETLYCPGLEARIYLSEQAARSDGMPVYLEINRPHAALPAFLQPGSYGPGIEEALGKPRSRSERRWQYGSNETTEQVTIEWQHGLIKALRWEWYLD